MLHRSIVLLATLFAHTLVIGCGGDDQTFPKELPDLGVEESADDAGAAQDAGPSRDAAPADDVGSLPDAALPDAGDDAALPDAEADSGSVDPIRACDTFCADQSVATDGQLDCDYDGLINADESALGTDPCEPDTDGDTLTDLEELQAGTDPHRADTDGDGLDDAAELELDLDPNDPNSDEPGVEDGDLWVANACNEDFSERVDPTAVREFESPRGSWRLALNAQFALTELNDPTAGPEESAAVFEDPTTEIAAFTSTYDARPLVSAPDLELGKVRFPPGSTVVDQTVEGLFDTWDRHDAVRGRWIVRTSAPMSTRQFRDQMLDATSANNWTGFPVAAGATYTEFRVLVTVIHRRELGLDQYVILAAVAPDSAWDAREKVQFRMDDVTNTTAIARFGDRLLSTCQPRNLSGERPKVDFYWVLDDSGSMEDYFQTMVSTARDFFSRLQNTNLDYRLGVTSTDPDVDGRIRPIPGWHTDQAAFTGEIDGYVCPGGNCVGSREFGLENAELGITYMTSSAAPPSVRIRPDARVITIVMSDEDAQSVKLAGGFDTPPGMLLIDRYIAFFQMMNVTLYGIYNDGTCPGIGDNGDSYRQVANATGGSTALLCGQNLTETINDILINAAGQAGVLHLPETPISGSLNVYKNGRFVPRSRVDGWDYFASSDAIAFFGDARPRAVQPGERGDDVIVGYSFFDDLTK